MKQIPIIPNPSEKIWCTFADYTYTTKKGIQIFIPKGFKTDLASIPLWFHWLYPKCRVDYSTGAVVHDAILKLYPDMGREFADTVFREILDITTDETTEEVFYESVSIWSRVKKWWHG